MVHGGAFSRASDLVAAGEADLQVELLDMKMFLTLQRRKNKEEEELREKNWSAEENQIGLEMSRELLQELICRRRTSLRTFQSRWKKLQ